MPRYIEKTLIVAIAGLLNATVAFAQSSASRWSGKVDTDVQRVGDSVVAVDRANVTLELRRLRGDSVTGTWQVEGRETLSVSGVMTDALLTLTTPDQAKVFSVNGETMRVVTRQAWQATVKAGELRGALSIMLGAQKAAPNQFELVRQ